MEEKDIKKTLDKTKKGIEEGWLWSEYDGDDFEESINKETEIPIDKESVFEKHKVINKDKTDK